MYTISAACIPRLRLTPAMEAGIADHGWALEELIALLYAEEVAA
jgi:hypothetical protein